MNNLQIVFWTDAVVATSVTLDTRWQLEKGVVSTSYEHRSFADAYWDATSWYNKTFLYTQAPGQAVSSQGALACTDARVASINTSPGVRWQFHRPMIAAPTIVTYSIGTADANWTGGGTTATVAVGSPGHTSITIRGTGLAGTAGTADAHRIHATADASLGV